MRILVVTGGIGSGKSEVCRILSELGYVFQYNADSRVKELYDSVPGLVPRIESALGIHLRDKEGRFVPKLLAERIFNDRQELETVEAIVFPELKKDFEQFASEAGEEDVVIFESATVMEKRQFEGFGDKVLLVDAPFDVRLERACKRDGIRKDAILMRADNQKLMNAVSEGYVDPRVDYVILNDGDYERLEQSVKSAMEVLFDKRHK